MERALYFTANRDVMDKDGEPVEIAGVRCRFRAGRHYEVQTRGNDRLIQALEERIGRGDLKRLTPAVGIDLVDKQAKADMERKNQRQAKAAPGARAAATIRS